jgi:lipopolysaccharide export system permease protein
MRRIDRYFLSEMTIPALVGVVMLLLLLIGNVLYMLLGLLYERAPLHEVGQILLYSMPEALMQAISGSMLLATALALNRLARDRELQAMRMAGVRLTRLILPFIAAGIAAAAVIFVLQEKVVPHTTHQAQRLIMKISFRSPTAVLSGDMFLRAGQNIIYIRQVDQQQKILRGVLIYRREPNAITLLSVPVAEVHGKQWQFKPDPLTGEMPQAFVFNDQGDLVQVQATGLESMLNLRDENDLWKYMSDTPTKPEELTLQQLQELRNNLRGFNTAGAYGSTLFLSQKQLTFFMQRKFALPLAALVAVLIAIPLSIHFGRSGGYIGLLLSVVVAFCFVVIQQWATVLGVKTQMLHPLIAAWAPNALFGLLGIILLFREE